MRKIVFFLIMIIFSSCISYKKYNQKLIQKHAPDELKTDLSIIKTSLEQAHPGVYWYISKEQLSRDFMNVEDELTDSLTSLAFYRKVAPLVSEIKCGHTRLVYPGLKINKNQKDSLKRKGLAPLTQLNYHVDRDELFIKSTKSKDLSAFKPGMQILSIDSISTKEILVKTKQLFSSDGFNQTFYNQVLDQSLANYYKLAYPQRDSSFLVLKDSSGLCGLWIKTKPPINKTGKSKLDNEKNEKQLAKEKNKLLRKNRYKGLDEEQKPLLDFKIDSNLKSTGILTVKSFSFPYNNFHRFFKETFREIEKKNIQHLILDLRGNGGGNLMSCNLLFRYIYNQSYKYTGRADMATRNFANQRYIDRPFLASVLNVLFYPSNQLAKLLYIKKDSLGFYSKLPTEKIKKPKKLVYDKSLLVLIDGYSFSATTLLSSNLQLVNRGIFIGEETGGGFNQCTAGAIPYLKLPKTGLKLRLPLKVIKPVKQRALIGRGVFPQYPVYETIEDILSKKDVIMDKAKDVIAKGIQNQASQ